MRVLLNEEGEDGFMEHDEDYDDEDYHEDEEYDDDDDDEAAQVERSVLLFNTWSTQGPRGVLPDVLTVPDGVEIEGVDLVAQEALPASLRISLMGRENRRQFVDKHACLVGSKDVLYSALYQDTGVSHVQLSSHTG